jgi:ribosomal-protein-serine acetyltransferase
MRAVEIRDERLCLRRLRNSEARLLVEAVQQSQPELNDYLPWATPDYNIAAARAFMDFAYEEERQDRGLHLSVFSVEDGRLMGGVGLTLRALLGHGEIGYWMRNSCAGQGHTTHAAKMMMDWGFRKFELRRINLTCDVRNAASRRIAEKLGMRKEGLLEEYMVNAHGPSDHHLYAILEREYRALGSGGL